MSNIITSFISNIILKRWVKEKRVMSILLLGTYTRQCCERITRNSVVMEFHPFQSKEPVSERIRFSFEKTTARNVTKEEASRVISRKIRVGMTFSLELARNCANEIAHSLLLTKANPKHCSDKTILRYLRYLQSLPLFISLCLFFILQKNTLNL